MTLEIPKQEWEKFFDDLSRRRFEWLSKIEVFQENIGSQVLAEGLPLVGITAEAQDGNFLIEISVGEETGNHLTHTIQNPAKIAFLSDEKNIGGIVELEEENGTKTLVNIIEPMPFLISYEQYEFVSTAT